MPELVTPHRVLVTGASGFVGGALAQRLIQNGLDVCTGVRDGKSRLPAGIRAFAVGPIDGQTDWQEALTGVDALVHCAARVHVMDDRCADPLAAFRQVNVAGTLRLAQQALESGVRRFVFVSSVKVLGEMTQPGRPFQAENAPAPQDPYGQSKLEAEQALQKLADASGLELVIVRPPLVYGPGVRANFAALMRGVQRGWPLPLGAINNRRSLVARDNLVDLLALCLRHPAAAGQIFLASDGEDVSTPELVRRLARAMHRPPRLIAVPVAFLQSAAALLGRRAAVRRLCGDLQVDIEKTRQLLGWRPPLTLDQGLKQALEGSG